MKVIRLSTSKLRPPLPPNKYSWHSFLLWSESRQYCWRNMSIKNSNDTIGNRTRNLPVCSAVPQPTEPPRCCSVRICNTVCVHCMGCHVLPINSGEHDMRVKPPSRAGSHSVGTILIQTDLGLKILRSVTILNFIKICWNILESLCANRRTEW